MSERKSINKWYPPDFDPSKVQKTKKASKKNGPAALPTVRLMAPFSMRCNECGQFIYKKTKFNARKEKTKESYLDVSIFRFYIRCPRCSRVLTFLTDPKNASYKTEKGLSRTIDPTRNESFADETLDERLDRLDKEQKEQDERDELVRLYGTSTAALMIAQRKKDHAGGDSGETDPLAALESRVAENAREIALENEIHMLRKRNATMEESGPDKMLAKAQQDLQDIDEAELDEAAKLAFNRTSDGKIIKRYTPTTNNNTTNTTKLGGFGKSSFQLKKPASKVTKGKANALGVIVKKK